MGVVSFINLILAAADILAPDPNAPDWPEPATVLDPGPFPEPAAAVAVTAASWLMLSALLAALITMLSKLTED